MISSVRCVVIYIQGPIEAVNDEFIMTLFIMMGEDVTL